MSDEDIAQNEPNGPRDVAVIRESIQTVLAWQQFNSLPIVTAATHEVILKHLPSVDQIIGEFATATRTKTVTENIDGKEVPRQIVEIDYNTRARVLEALKDLRDMVASKESKTNVNFGTQVAIGSLSTSGRNFESRVRKKREERGLKNIEDSEEQTIDAEVLDAVDDSPELDDPDTPIEAEDDA